jgi:hypothetical protein
VFVFIAVSRQSAIKMMVSCANGGEISGSDVLEGKTIIKRLMTRQSAGFKASRHLRMQNWRHDQNSEVNVKS